MKIPKRPTREERGLGPLERTIRDRTRLLVQERYPRSRLFVNAQFAGEVEGRWVDAGLGDGSPDLIGYIGPWGIFLAFEVKRPGKVRAHEHVAKQERWLAVAREEGAIAAIITSPEQAIEAIELELLARAGAGVLG